MEHEITAGGTASFHHLLEPDAGATTRFRIGLMAAVALHLALFAMNWPELVETRTDAPDRLSVHRFQVVKFVPPPKRDRQITVPPRRIPVPDPDPLGPEPIRHETSVAPVVIIPGDIVPFIPDPPPVPKEDAVPEIAVAGIDLEPPTVVHRIEPSYTETAKKTHIQGPVILSLLIDTEGRVADVTVLRGLPFGLTDNAVAAARQWRFQPSTLRGKPVAVRFTLTIRFKLTSG